MLHKMHETLHRLHHPETDVRLDPTAASKGKEMEKSLAKRALKRDRTVDGAFSRAEANALIRSDISMVRQKRWDEGNKGCHLCRIKT